MARRHTSLRRWTEALLLALGAGFAAVQIQPSSASARTVLVAFLAASLPVLAIHARHGAATAKEIPK